MTLRKEGIIRVLNGAIMNCFINAEADRSFRFGT